MCNLCSGTKHGSHEPHFTRKSKAAALKNPSEIPEASY